MSEGMIKTGALVIAIATGFAVTGLAAQERGPGGPSFEMLDLDGDGRVTEAELDAAAAERFAEVDTDGDGALSVGELTARAEARMAERMAERVARMVERLDTNGDGMIQSDEMAAQDHRARLLERFDADGDGAISAEEFAMARDERRHPGHGAAGHGDRHGPRDRG